jgi:hypothetical protein
MTVHKPRAFEFRLVLPEMHDHWYVWARKFGRQGGPWVKLGSVAWNGPDEPPECRGWTALTAGNNHHGPFERLGDATHLLWRHHVENLDLMGPAALHSDMTANAADPTPLPGERVVPNPPRSVPDSEFRQLRKRAGLNVSDATRVCGVINLKTGRRWERGVDFDGTPRGLPSQAKALLMLVVEENERARRLEDLGEGTQPRPIRDRLLAEAKQREKVRRTRRQLEGKPPNPTRGHGQIRQDSRARALERKRASRPAPKAAAEAAGAAGGGQA